MTADRAQILLSLGDSAMARLIAAHDWSTTPLGPIEHWPLSLQTMTTTMVRSTMAMAVAWGTAGIMIYNDAFTVIAGGRHPELLGATIFDGWPEVLAFNKEMMQTVLGGGSLAYRDHELLLNSHGQLRRFWANLDYSPVLDDCGQPGGVLTMVTETTDRVVATRELAAQHDHLAAMFDQAPGFIAMLKGPDYLYTLANQSYRELLGNRLLVGKTVREAIPEAGPQGFLGWLDSVYATGKPFVGRDIPLALPDGHGGVRDHYIDFVYSPVRDASGAMTGIFIQGSDVTERVLAAQELRASREEFRRLNDALITANTVLTTVLHDQANGVTV